MRSYLHIVWSVALVWVCLTPSIGRAEERPNVPRNIETSFIWSQSEAEMKCPLAAAQAHGRWTGQWRISAPGQTSFCEIVDLPATPLSTPARRAMRQVEVGPIWNQEDAEAKCRRAADSSDGRWTGQWRTTTPGEMSVCEIAYEPVRAPHREVREVEAGPIWSDGDAATKCPVVAYAVHGVWTGQWRTVTQGEMSVCEITGRGVDRD